VRRLLASLAYLKRTCGRRGIGGLRWTRNRLKQALSQTIGGLCWKSRALRMTARAGSRVGGISSPLDRSVEQTGTGAHLRDEGCPVVQGCDKV
jgi:hypothetical protein